MEKWRVMMRDPWYGMVVMLVDVVSGGWTLAN
jgi:hypothetical protein